MAVRQLLSAICYPPFAICLIAASDTAPAVNPEQALFVSEELPQTKRVMVKDEDICVHCGLCAERCPTAAWDMQKSDVILSYAGKAV